MENIIKSISDLFKVNEHVATWILVGFAVIIILLIVLIVVLIINGKQKKKENAVKTKIEDVVSSSNVEELPSEPINDGKEDNVVNQPIEDKKEEAILNEEIKAVSKEQEETKPVEQTPVVEEIPQEEILESKTGRIAIGKYEVFPVNDFYLYRLKASNGEIMVVSEIYKTAKGAMSAIETVKKNIENGFLQISMDKHGLWQFRLFASNKRPLVESANYATQQGCESAANSFKKFALISPVVILEEDSEHLMEEIHLQALSDKKGGKLVISPIEDEFEFKLLASNGVVLCTSNTYKTKPAIINGIYVLKEACKKGRFIIVKDKNNMYQFKLYSLVGRCVVAGEAYKNKNQAISAANSVSSFINMAEIVDKSIENENVEQQGENQK